MGFARAQSALNLERTNELLLLGSISDEHLAEEISGRDIHTLENPQEKMWAIFESLDIA